MQINRNKNEEVEEDSREGMFQEEEEMLKGEEVEVEDEDEEDIMEAEVVAQQMDKEDEEAVTVMVPFLFHRFPNHRIGSPPDIRNNNRIKLQTESDEGK